LTGPLNSIDFANAAAAAGLVKGFDAGQILCVGFRIGLRQLAPQQDRFLLMLAARLGNLVELREGGAGEVDLLGAAQLARDLQIRFGFFEHDALIAVVFRPTLVRS
jgi:hypothetical protein